MIAVITSSILTIVHFLAAGYVGDASPDYFRYMMTGHLFLATQIICIAIDLKGE